MIRPADGYGGRRGITLTEILISILIMGVGLISLATLFPLGLLRLRDAQRYSRSAYLTESAGADLEARNLLNKQSFDNVLYSPWNNIDPTTGTSPFTTQSYDPWVQDTGYQAPGAGAFNPTTGVTTTVGPGLPVAYDPLWRYQTGIYIGNVQTEGRFASGVGFLRPDPDGNPASAYGLQRLTNFSPLVTFPNTPSLIGPNVVPDIFVSPEDIVLQSNTGAQAANNLSPVVPDLSLASVNTQAVPVTDWRFTWMFTGQQADATNGTIFDGDVVIFENRPFGITLQNGQYMVDGEVVVEGVFGYAGGAGAITTVIAGAGYASAASQSVLLRWPATMPDPVVKVGGWIADVTYERNAAVNATRWVAPDFPYQRCHWYQIVKRTQPAPAVAFGGDPGPYRSMTVWVSTPLKSQTLLNSGNGQPVHVNAALIAPNVVNVFPRVIYTR